jgi:PAS domain S-box-containing protein
MSTGRSHRPASDESLPPEYDTLTSGIVLHDPATGAIIDANDHVEQLYGYTVARLREMTPEEFSANTYSKADNEFERRIDAAAAGEPQNFDWRIKRADGRLIWVAIQLSATTINGTEYVLGEISDITNYKHNDRRVSLFHRLLRHNLRNEITVIAGFASHIADIAASTPVARFAAKIDTAATSLTRVTESMRQVEATIGGEGAARTRRSAAVSVRDVAADLRSEHPAASISITEVTELWIDVDEAFDYALTHALENAIVHVESDEPSVSVAIDESPNTGRVEIRIDDEGPPIPAMELDALDDHSTTTATRHGSGCGLFVMKWCLESLGGELRIEPATGRGNSVYFYLPPQSPLQDEDAV